MKISSKMELQQTASKPSADIDFKDFMKDFSVAEKQYQKLDNSDEFHKMIKKENCSKSNLIYDANHSFYKYYRDREKFDNLSFKSKHSFLNEFFNELNKSINANPHKESTKERKINTTLELYNDCSSNLLS